MIALTRPLLLAALAGGFIGAGTANAQMSSNGPADIEGWTQMGWSAFSGSVINKGGSHMLLKNLPEGAKPLSAEKAKAAGIETVVFDRGGNRYAGRVAAIADGAREGGLNP